MKSTVDQYFVLYLKPVADVAQEIPVSVTKGLAGTTKLSDGRTPLPADRYRVATFDVAKPGDVDGDGVDDLTELADPAHMNPLNPAKQIELKNGAIFIADKATYETLSYQGNQTSRDAYLAGLEFMKFWLLDANTNHPTLYFMNTETFRAHPEFANAIGLAGGGRPGGGVPGVLRGDVVYDAKAVGPDGTPGLYRFAFQENDAYPFATVAAAYETLAASMPTLANKLMYHTLPGQARTRYQAEKALYAASRVPVREVA